MGLFDEQISRKPDRYPWTKQFMDAMFSGHWTDSEFDFASSVQDFKVNLNPQEREIVTRNLSAIGQIEVAVKTFWAKLGDNLPHPSITDLGLVMANIEVIHNNAYERLLRELDMESIFEENLKLDIIAGRVKYLRKYTHRFYKDSKKQFIYALILFTLFVENVSLFSQFYTISHFARFKNVLKEVDQQIRYTAKEELIHGMVGMKFVNTMREEYPDLFDEELIERIRSEAVDAFAAEAKIVDWAINGYDVPGLSAPILKEFIKNRINESLQEIAIAPVFEIDQKILESTTWFDEDLLGNAMTDFFSASAVEYSKGSQAITADTIF